MRNVEHHAQCIQCYQQCSHVQLLLVCVPKMTSTSIYSSSCNFITMQKNSRTLGSTAYERQPARCLINRHPVDSSNLLGTSTMNGALNTVLIIQQRISYKLINYAFRVETCSCQMFHPTNSVKSLKKLTALTTDRQNHPPASFFLVGIQTAETHSNTSTKFTYCIPSTTQLAPSYIHQKAVSDNLSACQLVST